MNFRRQESFVFEEGEGLVPSLYFFEGELAARGYGRVAGIDEAGRGCLAGPVVAACVVLPPGGEKIPGLNDSKKLTEKKRDMLCKRITLEAVDFGVGMADASEVDSINILEATKLAMLRAVEDMSAPPDFLIIDAVSLKTDIPQKAIIKGDARSATIAAASILAKVTRDRYMVGCHEEYPVYGFARHKGYGCQAHMDAIASHGPCPYHRMSFRGVKR